MEYDYKYDSEKYIELLKKSESLREKKKFLEKKDKSELLDYAAQLSDFYHWRRRSQYLKLIKLFLNLEIDGNQFVDQYVEIHRSTQESLQNLKKDFEGLANLKVNPKAFGFSEWTSEIDLCCDEFYPNFKEEDKLSFKFAKGDKELRVAVADILPEIEKYFDD